MHGTCRPCHLKERDRVERPDLDECATCHRQVPAVQPASPLRELQVRSSGMQDGEDEVRL
jgi:hypothetical protein